MATRPQTEKSPACPACGGTGRVKAGAATRPCPKCSGTGRTGYRTK